MSQQNYSFPQAVVLAGVQPMQSFDPIPSGWYNARVTDGAVEPGSKPGVVLAKFELTIIDGPYANRKVFDRITLANPESAENVAFSQQKLAALGKAIGRPEHQPASDVREFFNVPMMVKVRLKPAETKQQQDGTTKSYEAGNEVKGYDVAGSRQANNAAPAIVPGVAGAPAGAPPWQQPAAAAAPAPVAAAAAPAPAYTPPAQFTPPVAAQPWQNPAPVAAAPAAPAQPFVPPAPVVPAAPTGPVMLPAANGVSYEAYRAANWTDEQLIANGLMAAPQAAPMAPPAPVAAPPAPMAAPAPATAAPGAPGGVPPWQR